MVDDSSILFKTLYEMGTIRGCERISIKVGEYADVFKGAMEEGKSFITLGPFIRKGDKHLKSPQIVLKLVANLNKSKPTVKRGHI